MTAHTDDATAAVRTALQATTVPDTEEPLLERVSTVDVHDERATVVLDSAQGDAEGVADAVHSAVATVQSVETVDVEHDEGGHDVAGGVEEFDRIVAVASAKGGVGKSTVATHLAAAYAAEGEVAVFDADIHGPNVHRLLDVEGPVHADEDDRPVPIQTDAMEVMSVGLLESEVPLAWRGAMAHDAVSQLFAETAWQRADTLVIDLPPGTGDVVLTTLEEVPVDGLVVVTTPFHTAVTDTNRTVDLFRDEGVPVLGAVCNMAEVTCEHCGEPTALFEDALENLETEVLAELPFDQDFQGRPTPGEVPPAMTDLADAVTDELDAIGTFTAPPEAVDIRGLPPGARRQRVGDAFESLSAGEAFELVSDRDPTPVREFLCSIADVDPEALSPFEVERKTPEVWTLRTVHP